MENYNEYNIPNRMTKMKNYDEQQVDKDILSEKTTLKNIEVS